MVYLEKLFLNVEKTKYSFFQKPSKKYSIPLALPKPYIDNNRIQRSESINFLAVLLDENGEGTLFAIDLKIHIDITFDIK